MNSKSDQPGDTYQPPDTLPEPNPISESNPVLALFLGILAAAILGLVFFGATRIAYIYILFNSLLGVGVGWAISAGLKQSKYTNKEVLMAITFLCSLLAYLAFFLAYHQWLMSESGESLGFLEAVGFRAEYEPFLYDWQVGTVGNMIVWMIEYGITLYFAWRNVRSSILVCQMESVPAEVLAFVTHMVSEGHDIAHVQQELAKLGWAHPLDQARAIQAVQSLVSLVQEAEDEE